MDAFIYCADLICTGCAEAVKEDVTNAGFAPADPDNESSYDSDQFPKGPYSDGGGEADTPQHCGHCGAFLENPLTPDGYEWLRTECERAGVLVPDEDDSLDVERSAQKAQEDWDATGRHGGSPDEDAPLAQWIRFYPEAWN